MTDACWLDRNQNQEATPRPPVSLIPALITFFLMPKYFNSFFSSCKYIISFTYLFPQFDTMCHICNVYIVYTNTMHLCVACFVHLHM